MSNEATNRQVNEQGKAPWAPRKGKKIDKA